MSLEYLPEFDPAAVKHSPWPLDEMLTRQFAWLEDITEFLGNCEHGMDIGELVEEGTFTWWVNTYACTPEYGDAPIVCLGGGHMEPEIIDGWFCIPYAFHPAGVVFAWPAQRQLPRLGFVPLTIGDATRRLPENGLAVQAKVDAGGLCGDDE